MYRQIVHFLQGQVLVRIECGCPERMLNLCGARGIPFWELTWESPVCLTLRAVGRDLPRLRQAAEDAGGSLHLCRSGGVPVFWRRLRRRYVLLAGAVLALVLMFGGNLVIWDFQVSGNDTVPTETILRALEDYGITVGSPGLHIDQETMRNHVLLALPEVSWLAVNVRGCVAHVQVVERHRPPEAADRSTVTNIVGRSGPYHQGGGAGGAGHGAAGGHRHGGTAADLRGVGDGTHRRTVCPQHGGRVGQNVV